MALITRNDGVFLIAQSPAVQFGTIKQARNLFRVDLQRARDIAAGFRAAGVEAYASSDMGTIDDPAYVPRQAEVDLSVSWPGDWRVEIERLGLQRFCHSFLDPQGIQHSVIGKTPQEVVLKLSSTYDQAIKDYVKSITPEPVVEVAFVEPEVTTAPKKILRPGSRTWTPEDVAELEAQRLRQQAPKTPPAEVEYKSFYAAAQTTHIKMRMQKDPGFNEWLQKTGALALRSTEDGRNS
jgi:hypothetical protein